MLQEHYPNRICFLRKRLGLSQKQIAKLIGQNRGMISMYERGHLMPSLASACMLELLFKIPLGDLFPDFYKELGKELEANKRKLKQKIINPFEHP